MVRHFKYLVFILLLGACGSASAQSLATLISGLRVMNNTQVTTASGFHSITPTIEGNIHDSTLALLAQAVAAIGAANNLQAVTALGNSTTLPVYFGTGVYLSPNTGVRIASNNMQLWYNGVYGGGINGGAASATFYSLDPSSGFLSAIVAGPQTSAHTVITPDEGDGAGLDATVVIHTTKDPITVGANPAQYTQQTAFGYWGWKAGVPFMYLGDDGTGAFEMLLSNSATGGTIGVTMPNSSSAFTQKWPPASGTYAVREDTVNGTGLGKILTNTSGLTPTGIATVTNKRNVSRVQPGTTATTLSVNADNYDAAVLTALASNLTIDAPTGTPNDMDLLAYRIKDNGTARTLTWNAIFRDGSTVSKPTTTVISSVIYVVFVWNANASKWDLQSVNQL